MRLIIGMAGASGLLYGIRMLEILHEMPEVETHLILSEAARMNIHLETSWSPIDVEALADETHKIKDIAAPLASGSYPIHGMVVAPCSMKSLSAITHSYADNLLHRAADVTLKEHRRLVLMPRETPLHTGHCKLLYEASQIGAIIAPPMPAMYARPQSIDDLIDHTVGRVLDLFGIETGLVTRWEGVNTSSAAETIDT